MKLLFKQRFFSWFDSYDIYAENGNVENGGAMSGDVLYTVKGQLAWGHCLKIFDVYGQEVGTVKERVFTFLPKFELYAGGEYIGCISREFTFFKPTYNIDCNGWQVHGDWVEWNYAITGPTGEQVAAISKELWNFTDTYVIDVARPEDALCALMVVLAIDAEKCSRK